MSVLSAGKATTRALWLRATHHTAAGGPQAAPPRTLFRRLPCTLFTFAGAEGPQPYIYKAHPLIRCLPHDSIIEWTNATARRDPDLDRYTATTTSSAATPLAAGEPTPAGAKGCGGGPR
jgi:hypothetical protein